MIRFDALENMGLRFAGMTQLGDGDFAGDIGERGLPRLLSRLNLGDTEPTFLKQVHGTHVVEIDGPLSESVEADGAVTTTPGQPLVVRVADCVPVFLYAPEVSALALLHAGRLGTGANISAVGVSELERRFGASSANLTAAIGPSIGPCCYEVSEEMASEWGAKGSAGIGSKTGSMGSKRPTASGRGSPSCSNRDRRRLHML